MTSVYSSESGNTTVCPDCGYVYCAVCNDECPSCTIEGMSGSVVSDCSGVRWLANLSMTTTKTMELYICPICGSRDIDKPVKTVESLCWECGNFIIPLATPQEII